MLAYTPTLTCSCHILLLLLLLLLTHFSYSVVYDFTCLFLV